MTSSDQQSCEASEEDRLRSLVAAVAASHSKFGQSDIESVLVMALQGSGLRAPCDEWVTDTAQQISNGHIMPITSRRGLDLEAILGDGDLA